MLPTLLTASERESAVQRFWLDNGWTDCVWRKRWMPLTAAKRAITVQNSITMG